MDFSGVFNLKMQLMHIFTIFKLDVVKMVRKVKRIQSTASCLVS